jgi:protein required for attachment to host cells
MTATMFVVADQGGAQLYKLGGTRVEPTLEEIERLEHPEAHYRQDASASGTRLQHFESNGPDEERERRFVRQLVDRLNAGHSRGEFRKLYIAAPAQFVGKIRQHYTSALSQAIEREIIGDYTQQDLRSLQKRMRKWLD